MTKNDQPQSILNNAIVGLLILFTIPALLVFGGFWFIAVQGRIPGGETVTCERTLGEYTFRRDVYSYTAGLTPYEIHTLYAPNGDAILEDTVQAPAPLSCDESIQPLGEGYLLKTQKSIALINPDGTTLATHNVCDDPRPDSGRCDVDPLNIVEVDFSSLTDGTLVVQESVVDEYGQPQFRDGQRLLIAEYRLTTQNGGESWQIRTID